LEWVAILRHNKKLSKKSNKLQLDKIKKKTPLQLRWKGACAFFFLKYGAFESHMFIRMRNRMWAKKKVRTPWSLSLSFSFWLFVARIHLRRTGWNRCAVPYTPTRGELKTVFFLKCRRPERLIFIKMRNRMWAKKKVRTPWSLSLSFSFWLFVPRKGIEPSHPCEWQILSLLRLPISPPGLSNK
jgi:hypothetical protein